MEKKRNELNELFGGGQGRTPQEIGELSSGFLVFLLIAALLLGVAMLL